MSTMNTFILLKTTSTPTTVKCKVLLRFLGNNIYAKDPQCNVLTLSFLLGFNRDTEKEIERKRKKKVMRKGVVTVTFYGEEEEKGYSFVIFPRYTRSSFW
jgi:hypothetical protein